jgi:uncharacterized membrane protein YfcA
MSLSLFMLIVFGSAVGAGLLGSLTGLGGGIILTPVLVLLLGVDMKLAIGASLIAVIATSCGAAPRALSRGLANAKLACVLEVATVLGACVGVLLAARSTSATLQLVFGLVLLWTAISGLRDAIGSKHAQQTPPLLPKDDASLATKLDVHGTFPDANKGSVAYSVHRLPTGLLVMFGAGALSALVGIGSGIVKVLAMDKIMKLPFHVSTATSTLMIGVTAAASAGAYLHKGQIHAELALPVTLGALLGSAIGARLLPKIPVRVLRIVFGVVVLAAGAQMISRGVRGTFFAPALSATPATSLQSSPLDVGGVR